MNRILLAVFSLLSAGSTVFAQTEEPIHTKITVPESVDLTLDGTLTLPATRKGPIPVVLLIAGSGSTDRDGNSPSPIGTFGTLKPGSYRMLADSLVRQGIAVARYDKRGSGTNIVATMKALKPQDHRFEYYVSDAVGFVRQLQADNRFSKVIVAGHSEGSLVGMLATIQTKASGLISIAGAGQNIADVLKKQFQALPESQRQLVYRDLDSLRAGQTVSKPAPSALMVLHPLLQGSMMSWMKYDPAQEIKQIKGPILIINGKHDLQVATGEAELLKAARPDATLSLFDQMNHVLKNAPMDRLENFKTYTDPSLPLTPGLTTTIAQFVKQ
ncbi:alpha/beta hydrolase [Spirosoma agri]|uniref:Alpha/beta hydrolase n=1 Tax=Spirosoma agri TaxID=1987381 RepID=A0A6M0IFJ6_9BACT|nr:alpha/beta fold hydrolase [Spirosoma agri]NEU67050.1 alpha/beta hydrolase [Spirosoma agri]